MKLLTQEIQKKLPALYSQEQLGKDAVVHVKFFCPWNQWTWYATEYDPEDKIFFGLVVGLEKELGYFSLEELESIRGPHIFQSLGIERDMHFKPRKLSELMKS